MIERQRSHYVQKLRGVQRRSGIIRPRWYQAVAAGAGGALAIAALHLLAVELNRVPCFLVPFGASCALVFGVPTAPVSQPRNVLLGHILSALIGMGVYALFGVANWWTLALAIGLAMAAMSFTGTFHPPAAVTVLLPVLQGITDPTWPFVSVTTGAVIVVLIGLAYNNLYTEQKYPVFWW